VISPPPPVDLAALGIAVARARQTAELTLDALAEYSGVSRRMLVEVEQGRVNCTIGVLHAIAHAVNTPVGRLAETACAHDHADLQQTQHPVR
jgi:putative transcriptional regulator